MNHVGIQGKGESVWLAWFAIVCLDRFQAIAAHRGDIGFAGRCTERSVALAKAVEEQAWDGEWYRRAYFDNGRLSAPRPTPNAASIRWLNRGPS